MEIIFAERADSEIVAFVVDEGGALPAAAAALDDETGGLLTEALSQERFTGKHGQQAYVVLPKSCKARRAVLIGAGKPSERDGRAQEKIGALLVKTQANSGFKSLALHIDDVEFAARAAQGAELASYRFDTYFTKLKDDQKPSLDKLMVVGSNADAAGKAYEPLSAAAAQAASAV